MVIKMKRNPLKRIVELQKAVVLVASKLCCDDVKFIERDRSHAVLVVFNVMCDVVVFLIVFIGPCVAQKRWQAADLPDDRMYSGDVGYMDEEGHVFVIDRLKDIINRGGEKIFTIQVEEVIRQYPGIHDVSVYAINSEKYGEEPAAAIIPEPGVSIEVESLRIFLTERIAKYKVPVLIRIVESFPVTQNGKVRKAELRRLTEQGGWQS